MSAAGDRLRAERERFERELRLSEATRDAAVGADDSAHFLADSPRTDDDAVWDLPGEEASTGASAGNAGPVMPTTPYREAMRAARAVDAAPAAPPSPKLESPTSDMTASIREALDAAERGLRASVIATDQMERLAASRGTRAASSRRGETATPRDAAALVAAGDEDPEAQAYLKGVLRMIYGGGDDDEDEEEDDDDEDAPARALRAAVARARDGLSTHLMGDDSAREAVVARRAHTRASAAPAAKAPPSGSRADAAVPGVDSEPFAFRTDAASATAVDFRYEVFGATAQATVTRTTAMASAPPPTTTTETDAPAASSPAAASPGGLPPTPTAVKARAASSGSPEAAAMFDEFHRLERGLAEYVDGSPEPGSSPEEKPRAEPPAKRPAARSTSPYRPATADDVVAVAGGSTHTAAVRSAATTANAPPPPRVDAAPKAASKQNSPAASSGASSPSSTIDPVAREALDAMAPRDRADNPAVPDVAAPWSAALDAQTEAEAARKREARRKVEELLGGAFDYEEIRSVARAATAEAEKDHSSFVAADATTLGSSVPTTPPRVAPNGTARPRVARAVEADEETEKDFFADVREAAAFGAGSSFAADPASVVADADASIEAFRAAMRAEVATRIVASASGVSEEVTEMTRARRAATQALRKSVAGATRSRADARSARDAARKRATPPPRGAWRPPPEPPASLRPREASAARASIEARAEADFAAGRSRSAPARERPGASQDGTVASFAARSSEAPAVLSARGASAREAARRRGARAANAAKAREEAEKKREFELLKAERAAEAKRAAAEKKRVEVAFGRRASKADGNGAKSDGDNENGAERSERKRRAPPARPRVTEVKPFNLSTGNHTRNKEELLAERENRRDPDVWEPSPAKSAGRLESEAGDEIERFAPATPPDASGRRRRGDDAEKEGESSEKRRTSPRLDAARHARDELKRRSRAASRQTRVIHAASEAAAPAIAAAEEARRDAEAAAAAAARAAAAASAAEALMMAEARRLRERRKELYSRGKDAEFAPARAASLEMDDAPLMASYSSLPDTSLAAARQAAEDFGRDVSGSEIDAAWHRSSETPEKPPLRVSASLASPSPVKPPKLPVAGGPREPVQYDPSRRPGEDARAASDGGAPAPAPAEPERRPAVEPFAFAAEDDGVTTPPSPRSPAVSWTMGALDLPGARLPEPPREESERTDDARAEAEPADAAASAASEKPKREVPAVLRRAAEARAVLAAAAVGPERGVGETSTETFEGEKPVKASGRRLLFRGDDLAYAPPAEVSAVSKISKTAPATSRSADGVESDGDVTDYGSIDGESDASDGDLTAAAAAAVAAQLARADGEE